MSLSPLESSSLPTDAAKTRVAGVLRDRILGGTLRFGEVLPSERQLSEQLGVGRTVVRQALAELNGEGLLERSGPRSRRVTFDRGEDLPAWIKRSVAILTPGRLAGGKSATRARWLQYTTLGTIDHLRERDVHAITLSLGAIDNAELQRLARSKPLGILIPELSGGEVDIVPLADLFQGHGVPVVCYGGSPTLSRFDRVASDHEAGSLELTRSLIRRGCRSLVRFWPRPWDTYWLEARSRGLHSALAEAGLDRHPIVEFPVTSAPIDDRVRFEYVVKQVAGFLLEPLRKYRPDALLMATDRDVAYAAAALRLHGLEPGRDVLIAGYDNYFQHCEERAFESALPAFTVDKGNQRAGTEMVQLLLDRASKALPEERQLRVIAQEVIEPSMQQVTSTETVQSGTSSSVANAAG